MVPSLIPPYHQHKALVCTVCLLSAFLCSLLQCRELQPEALVPEQILAVKGDTPGTCLLKYWICLNSLHFRRTFAVGGTGRLTALLCKIWAQKPYILEESINILFPLDRRLSQCPVKELLRSRSYFFCSDEWYPEFCSHCSWCLCGIWSLFCQGELNVQLYNSFFLSTRQ